MSTAAADQDIAADKKAQRRGQHRCGRTWSYLVEGDDRDPIGQLAIAEQSFASGIRVDHHLQVKPGLIWPQVTATNFFAPGNIAARQGKKSHPLLVRLLQNLHLGLNQCL